MPEEPEFLLDADGSLWTYVEHDGDVPIYQSAEKDAVFPKSTVEEFHGPLTPLRRA